MKNLRWLNIKAVFAVLLAALLVASQTPVEGWTPTPICIVSSPTRIQSCHGNVDYLSQLTLNPREIMVSTPSPTRLYASVQETPTTAPSSPSDDSDESVSAEEWTILMDLYAQAKQASSDAKDDDKKEAAFQKVVEEALPKFSPALIMKLRNGDCGTKVDDEKRQQYQALSQSLERMLNQKLETARDTLTELMNAGEIKKLDALIGKAARAQRLDVAFFQVLQMNMHDAAMEMQQQQQSDEKQEEVENAETANRLQILQHIHTRCQEEVEKTINPGIALLSKLLRTDVDSIRRNQLEHYLCPQPTTITAPDGKQIELKNPQNEKSLVDHQDFVNAIANAVKQIRTVEEAGGTDREVAADMVESCRQVAKEARIVIGEKFGKDSEQLIAFEDALMPVFRPSSPDSPYIQGEKAPTS
jgi:hypothetical protein